MKRIFASAAFLLPLSLFAVSSGGDHQVFVNGKLIGTAVTINGVLALPLEDLARATGNTMTLEPAFEVQGQQVNVRTVPGRLKWQDITLKRGVTADSKQPAAPGAFVGIHKDGVLTTNLLRNGGKLYIPIADVARAFGGTFTAAANMRSGDAIRLNFSSNPNAILVGL